MAATATPTPSDLTHDTPQSAPPRTELRHEPALDGLRGAAVTGVLLYHGGHLTGGYLGVDAFFVLSGFLITSLLIVEHGKRGTISLRAFWARRARRLLPALFGVLVAVALYAAFVAQQDELAAIRGDALATLAYVANWRSIAAGGDYFAIFRSPSPLQHTWSLAIEEQFYFVWPVVVLLLTRGCRARETQRRVLWASIGLGVASVALAQTLYSAADPSRVYYGTDTRASSVLIGAALASALALYGPVRSAWARRLLEAAGCVAVVWLAYTWATLAGHERFLYRGGLVVCALAVAVVIAACTHPQRGPVFTGLAFAPLRALGLISYGLYLWHWPVYVYLSEARTGLAGFRLLAVRLGVTLLIAVLSYRLIEQPIRRQQVSRRVLWIATPAVCALLVVALLATTRTTPLPVHGRFATKTVPVAGSAEWKRLLRPYRAARAESGSSTRVLIVGDSIAEHVGPNPADARRRTRTESFGLIGCSIVDAPIILDGYAQVQNANCASWPTLYSDVIRVFDPDVTVVMLGPWEMFDRQVDGVQIKAGSPRLTSLLVDQLERQHDIVTGRGGEEILLTTPCFTPPHADGNADDIWRTADRWDWLNHVWRQFAARHPHDVHVAPFGAFVCPDGRPRRATNGETLRADGIHFTPAGAATVLPRISEQVAALRRSGELRGQ